jgi:salicylate hydroxylase
MSLIGQSITLLGAGIAGLACARALALRGAEVTVLEQADAIREVGAGLQISPNGAAVLRALGLGEALDRAGTAATGVRLIDGPTAEPVLSMDLRGRDFRLLHRADLIALLLEGARGAGAELRLLQRIETVDLTGARPRIVTAQGAALTPDLLIGADGLHSPTRAALNGAAAAVFTGQVAWRAVLPEAETEDTAALAEVHMGPGRHLVSYPLRGGRQRNIVAVEERSRWAEESWTLRDDPMDLRLAFGTFSPRVRGWLDRVEEVHLWGLFRHPVARYWHGGRAVILGDAAHPTLPMLASGAAMAMEDGFILARCLQALPQDVPAALLRYEQARLARTARVVRGSSESARRFHNPALADATGAAAYVDAEWSSDKVHARYDWLFSYRADEVSLD